MIWLCVILLILVSGIVYLLTAPFYFEVYSPAGIMRFRLHHLASGALILQEDSIFMRLRVTWWQKDIDLLAPRPKKKKAKPAPEKPKKQRKAPRLSFRQIKAILKSFIVNELYLTIDTGDEPLNGMLFPVFYGFARLTEKPISINFNDRNILILNIQNSTGRMLWAWLKNR